jgi:hypothetical protein
MLSSGGWDQFKGGSATLGQDFGDGSADQKKPR